MAQTGLAPGYEQKPFASSELAGRLRLVASPDGRNKSVTIHQDVLLLAGRLSPNESVSHGLAPERKAYIQVARGELSLNGMPMIAGDGAAVAEEASLEITATADTEVLLFDLP